MEELFLNIFHKMGINIRVPIVTPIGQFGVTLIPDSSGLVEYTQELTDIGQYNLYTYMQNGLEVAQSVAMTPGLQALEQIRQEAHIYYSQGFGYAFIADYNGMEFMAFTLGMIESTPVLLIGCNKGSHNIISNFAVSAGDSAIGSISVVAQNICSSMGYNGNTEIVMGLLQDFNYL